jgi:hypothetical protein
VRKGEFLLSSGTADQKPPMQQQEEEQLEQQPEQQQYLQQQPTAAMPSLMSIVQSPIIDNSCRSTIWLSTNTGAIEGNEPLQMECHLSFCGTAMLCFGKFAVRQVQTNCEYQISTPAWRLAATHVNEYKVPIYAVTGQVAHRLLERRTQQPATFTYEAHQGMQLRALTIDVVLSRGGNLVGD